MVLSVKLIALKGLDDAPVMTLASTDLKIKEGGQTEHSQSQDESDQAHLKKYLQRSRHQHFPIKNI